jgi:diacylglycerol kinase family enzyme
VSRRLAAGIALVAPVAAVALAIGATIWQPWVLVLLIVAIPVGAAATWYAMTRRGLPRLIALLVAVLAMAAALTVGLLMFLVQLVLLAVFAVAGGYALGPDTEALLVCACRARMAGRAQRGVLLINPKSGGGKATRFDLAGEAAQRGIRAVALTPGDDLTQLAEQVIAEGTDLIGMAGGDGSQALVATVAMHHGIPFVCIPSGTRNHFALDLGLNRDDVVGALDAFTDGVERVVDLGQVNDRVFVNNASMGVYARVVQSDAYRDAKAQTWTRMLPDMLGPGANRMGLEFDGPDNTRHTDAPLVLVSNNPYRLNRFTGKVSRPKLDTGHLGIVVAQLRRAAAEIAELQTTDRRQLQAQLRRLPGLIEWSKPSFVVESRAAVPIGVDGEALVLDAPLRFVSLPGALRVRLPRHASGLVRAKRRAALNRHDFSALVRIVAGHPATPAQPAALAHLAEPHEPAERP